MSNHLKPLIAANWKMHGDKNWASKPAAFDDILPKSKRGHLDVLLCPPAHLIGGLVDTAKGLDIAIGGQNCHSAVSGAHTGEISAEMLADIGASYVIAGHSERRAAGETDQDVASKAEAAARAGLIPIICVGESLKQREAGIAVRVVKAQIKASVPDINDYVLAYEPIWAIGTGKIPTMEDIAEMHKAIRGEVGKGVRILYGGSVKPANAADILAVKDVNGALIGGASLEMDSLAAIAKATPH